MSKDIMDREDAEIATVVREMNAERLHESEPHPTTDELLAYHERTLAEDAAESLRDHVALCPECARRSLDVAAFCQPDTSEDEDGPAGRAAAAGWNALRNQLRKEGVLHRFDWTAWTSQLFGSLRFAYAVAAVFFVATLSTSILLVEQSRRVATLSQPAPFQQVDLHPAAEEVRRSPSAPAGTRIRTTGEELAFSLSFSVDPPAPRTFQARIFDLGRPGEARWTVEPLPRDADDFFSLRIPGGLLPLGSYRIDVCDPDGAVLAEYFFEIVEPPSGGRLDPGEDP